MKGRAFLGQQTYSLACEVPSTDWVFLAAWPRQKGTQEPISVPAVITSSVIGTQQNKKIAFPVHRSTTPGTPNHPDSPVFTTAILA